jgi:hypothetical protein
MSLPLTPVTLPYGLNCGFQFSNAPPQGAWVFNMPRKTMKSKGRIARPSSNRKSVVVTAGVSSKTILPTAISDRVSVAPVDTARFKGTDQLSAVGYESSTSLADGRILNIFDISGSGLSASRMGRLMSAFQQFRVNNLVFRCCSSMPTTTAGAWVMYYVPDRADMPVDTSGTDSAFTTVHSSRARICDSLEMRVSQAELGSWKYIAPVGSDVRLSSAGFLLIAYKGPTQSLDRIGNIYMDWDISVKEPAPAASLAVPNPVFTSRRIIPDTVSPSATRTGLPVNDFTKLVQVGKTLEPLAGSLGVQLPPLAKSILGAADLVIKNNYKIWYPPEAGGRVGTAVINAFRTGLIFKWADVVGSAVIQLVNQSGSDTSGMNTTVLPGVDEAEVSRYCVENYEVVEIPVSSTEDRNYGSFITIRFVNLTEPMNVYAYQRCAANGSDEVLITQNTFSFTLEPSYLTGISAPLIDISRPPVRPSLPDQLTTVCHASCSRDLVMPKIK